MDRNQESANRNTIPTYRRATDRDAMLNMLSKRAIIDYGERVCALKDCPTTYVVVFDLDNFKAVNDNFGHMFGDEVLYKVTDIINSSIADHGMVGRIGGDEIMIITKDINDKQELRPFLKTIRESVEVEFKDKLDGISLTCSMGAAAYPEHGSSFAKVMDLADKMLYLGKEKGRNRYIIYTPEMHADIVNGADGAGGIKNVFAKTFDKIGLIQYLMDDYLLNGTTSNEIAFGKVGEAFSLKEILIVYDKGKVAFRWTPDKVGYQDKDLHWMELNDRFYDQFKGDPRGENLFIVDGLYDLNETREDFKKKLMERDAESVLFYKLHYDDEAQGFAMFVKHGQRQKWSEYELLALSTVGKIFEISQRSMKRPK